MCKYLFLLIENNNLFIIKKMSGLYYKKIVIIEFVASFNKIRVNLQFIRMVRL